MAKEITLLGPNKDFESIKKINKQSVEYWEARELMPLLGYKHWQKSEEVIVRAIRACTNSAQYTNDHFNQTVKMVKIGSNTVRKVKDYKLDRYACYLIAQNGDPRKLEIATAQTYFAIQTRKQEIFQQMDQDRKRLFTRKEVRDHNKKLFKTAQTAGVSNFGKFNNYGYLGLYGLVADDIKIKKGIGKDDILDRAGSTELAANLFRITQTDEKIIKEKISGEEKANTTHFDVGSKVRNTIKEIGGTMPENLKPEKHIKKIKAKDIKMIKNKKLRK